MFIGWRGDEPVLAAPSEVRQGARVYERGHLRRPYVERLLEEHDSGRVNHGLRLWNLLVLELWHRHYVDGA